MIGRREFLKSTAAAALIGSVDRFTMDTFAAGKPGLIRVAETRSAFEREKLLRPFGFKGGYLTELWQVVSELRSSSGMTGLGLATQSVLYGDADLFAAHSEAEGNTLMYTVVKKSLEIVRNTPFSDPVELFDKILPQVVREAAGITSKPDLNINFVYNALVSLDNAAWLLYAAENRFTSFESMIPERFRPALSHRNDKIAIMYQVPYGMPMKDLREAASQGYFVFKIKTGFPGTQEQMLKGDIDRLTVIHRTLKDLRTAQTANGKLIYTMDANARYERKETLEKYLDHARKIGAFEHILLYEEPLSEDNDENVSDLGVRIGADESAHDEASTIKRLDQGYQLVVLKGIAKTLSMSVKIAELAASRNVPCMCADLTVNPVLVDWHKNLAAHLAPFPGLGMGLMETNGDMNYVNWEKMVAYHPGSTGSWFPRRNGVFELNSEFYDHSAGIFSAPEHYRKLLSKK